MPDSMEEIFGDHVYRYTRAQAIEDGELVPVEEALLHQCGIKLPTCVSRRVWFELCEWDDADPMCTPGAGQSTAGRLWDVLRMTRLAMGGNKSLVVQWIHNAACIFRMQAVPRDGKSQTASEVRLKVVVGPGDNVSATNPDPVVTIMMEDED